VRSLWAVLLALALLTSCSTPMSQLRQELGPRAATELRCAEEKLAYEELDRMISSTKVKVTGCERIVVYEMIESRWKMTRDQSKGVLAK